MDSMMPSEELPTTGLRRQIQEDLAAGAPDGEVKAACIDIEADRHHLLPRGPWHDGHRLDPGDVGYDFCLGPYGQHVMTCENLAHLEAAIHDVMYSKEPRFEVYVTLVKQSERHAPTPVDDDSVNQTPWHAWRTAQKDTQSVYQKLQVDRIEALASGEETGTTRSSLVEWSLDEGWRRRRLNQALDTLVAWNVITVGERIHVRLDPAKPRRVP